MPLKGWHHASDTKIVIRSKRALQTNVKGGGPEPRHPVDRMFDHISFVEGCWQWTGARHKKGYGVFGVGSMKDGTRRAVRVHRWFWEWLNGAVPTGKELDHLCRNRLCVNPDHLEPVTHTENIRRAVQRSRSDLLVQSA